MKLKHFLLQLSIGFGALFFIAATQAGIPLWHFTPDSNYPPKILLSTTSTAIVKYTVKNNSSKPHNLIIKPQAGITQTTPCKVGPKSTCTLTLAVTGSELPAEGLFGGPILCQTSYDGSPNSNQCYRPRKKDRLAIIPKQGTPILSASTENLALSISGLNLDGQPSGRSRVITITNNGDSPATGLSISYPTWPLGTVVNSSATTCINGETIAIGGSCTITITPGNSATLGSGNAACTTGIEPIPGVVSVTSNNSNRTLTNVLVLGYGCQHQGGFIYAMTESADLSQSITGKVASLINQASPSPGVIWSSNGVGSTLLLRSYDLIPWIAETLTIASSYAAAQQSFIDTYINANIYPFPLASAFINCSGAIDGKCNTHNIVKFYTTYTTQQGQGPPPTPPAAYYLLPEPTNPAYYAAGICTATINGYSDWYLPAICELNSVYSVAYCPTVIQDMRINLSFLIGSGSPCSPPSGTQCLQGTYWSSTQYSPDGKFTALWSQFNFNNSTLSTANKFNQFGVRCSRAF